MIIRDVIPGNHVVEVSKEGYVSATSTIYVSKNEIKKVAITLVTPDSGPLSVITTPSGAQVILDGQPVGVTPLSLPSVSGGQHNVLLTMEGFNDYTENISVTSNGVTIDAILIPSSFAGGSSIGLSPTTFIGALLGAFLLLGLKRHP
jgi:hypothetical protein